MPEDSSEEDEEPITTKQRIIEKEEHIGKVVCVENTETKKKAPKENWFPALVVAPTAQDAVRIRVKDEYLVRSFKDGRYYTVPKKEATDFNREKTSKQNSDAVQAAQDYLNNDSLPTHWDRDVLFALGNCSSDSDGDDDDSDTSDDEPREEKDHFVAQLYKYMDDRGTPLNKGPSIVNKDVDLYRLFRAVQKLGGYNKVTTQSQWKQIALRLGYTPTTTSIQNLVKQAYKKFLLPFEEFDRKLGCTMVAHPRANRIKGRSLVRANSVASPKPEKDTKSATSGNADESENTSESGTENLKVKRKLSTSSCKVKALVEKYEEKMKDEIKEEEVKEIFKEIVVKVEKDIPREAKESKKLREVKEIIKEQIVDKETEPSTSTSTRMSSKLIKEEIVLPSISNAPAQPSPVSSRKEKQPKRPQTALEERKTKKRKPETESEKIEKEKEKAEQNDFPIEVGNKLKVYYHEQKVTYEAKVIEISMQQGTTLYLVHYTGWNTRYDEWVPKERIAENLTNNKTNKRAKTGGTGNGSGAATKANEQKATANIDKYIGSTSSGSSNATVPSKMLFKRGRGSSRGESQPPRSTTPSSVASNSSRTKSPATPAQRRTTRGQPNSIRRTSNNTDISSLQTDTDSDSDEPVKKTPNRKIPIPRSSQPSASTSTNSGTKTNSNPSASSEEESTGNNTKGRDFDLNQIRSELKGFKELKSPSPDIDNENESNEKKFEFPSTASNTESGDSISQDITKAVTSDSKTSSDTSSESDSYGDDDSQFSDKTTMLENISEKLEERYKAGKLDTDVFKKIVFPASNELMDKVATLKPSGIEKIIKNSLAEKSKLPEAMTMKALCEKSPLKQIEKEKEREKVEERDRDRGKEEKLVVVEVKSPAKALKLSPKIEQTVVSKIDKIASVSVEKLLVKSTFAEKMASVKLNMDNSKENLQRTIGNTTLFTEKPSSTLQLAPPLPSLSSVIPVSCTRPKTPVANSLVETTQSACESVTSKQVTMIPVVTASDIYEFKEPEPFEFETVKKLSPDIDKKPKKKSFSEIMTEPVKTPLTTSPPSAKKLKKSPTKEEKLKSLKITEDNRLDDQVYSPPITSPTALTPKVDSIFDSLRKSPSFNLTLQAQNMQDDLMVLSSATSIFVCATPLKEEKPEPIATTSKPTFINTFVEAKSEEPSKIFKIKANTLDENIQDEEDPEDKPVELETVKKILLAEEVYEPPKIEKPSSIADKVLKAINQQQQLQHKSEEKDIEESKPSVITELSHDKPITIAIQRSDSEVKVEKSELSNNINIRPMVSPSLVNVASSSASIIPEPPKIELPAIIKKDIETPPKKPVLSSPEHKVDILESIAPKNNDLSETIQKLESVIQQTADLNHLTDDSSDSTDSEQRLIIEDESLSSETQNDFAINVGSKIIDNHIMYDKHSNAESSNAIDKTDIDNQREDELQLQQEEQHHYQQQQSEQAMLPHSFTSKYASGFFGEQQKAVSEKPPILAGTSSLKTVVDLNAAYTTPLEPPAPLIPLVQETNPIVSDTIAYSHMSASNTIIFDENDAESAIPATSIKKDDLLMVSATVVTSTSTVNISSPGTTNDNSSNKESLSLLLCEETIPGSPTPPCPREIGADIIPLTIISGIGSNATNNILSGNIAATSKKPYDLFASPHPTGADIKSVPMDIETSHMEVKEKIELISPHSSPRDSLSHDDSSEEIRKQGLNDLI